MLDLPKKLRRLFTKEDATPGFGILELLKYISPGLLVTVGFIDPGNWASNFAAGSEFGYALLWVVTLSTIMLIILQHNAAHLGIVSGLCLSEAATKYLPKKTSRLILGSAMIASVSTSLAEILGGAIALNILFGLPIRIGAVGVAVLVYALLSGHSYPKIERFIIAFVSIIGLSFIYELFLVDVDWGAAARAWVTPDIPDGSMLIVMSVLGAVIMPHNLFLHSEVIQSRQWNKESKGAIERHLKYELLDTSFSMLVGWAINSAMILLAAATFFREGVVVDDLQQAAQLLYPLLGNAAVTVFGTALLFSGIASTITSAIAAGSIYAGVFDEPYNIEDIHSKTGVVVSLGLALIVIFLISDPFKGLIVSQAVLSLQLPITVFLQLRLTSSREVMGEYANPPSTQLTLYAIATLVTGLNAMLLWSLVR
ncbi:MAG: Nramp family divalent metal transporter [Propionivibrio sp.]